MATVRNMILTFTIQFGTTGTNATGWWWSAAQQGQTYQGNGGLEAVGEILNSVGGTVTAVVPIRTVADSPTGGNRAIELTLVANIPEEVKIEWGNFGAALQSPEDAVAELRTEVLRLKGIGNNIEAIALLRGQLGLGLKEAKEMVDGMT